MLPTWTAVVVTNRAGPDELRGGARRRSASSHPDDEDRGDDPEPRDLNFKDPQTAGPRLVDKTDRDSPAAPPSWTPGSAIRKFRNPRRRGPFRTGATVQSYPQWNRKLAEAE